MRNEEPAENASTEKTNCRQPPYLPYAQSNKHSSSEGSHRSISAATVPLTQQIFFLFRRFDWEKFEHSRGTKFLCFPINPDRYDLSRPVYLYHTCKYQIKKLFLDF